MDLSFSGAGFMGVYYFGVVDCWRKFIPKERVNRVAGASAGSLIATYYLLDLPLKECIEQSMTVAQDLRSRPLGVFDRSNQIVDILPRELEAFFPEDAHKRVSGRLHVCMTRLKDRKKVIVSEFDTRQELIDALNCSCFIPLWSGNHVSTYRGQKHIDGGLADNLPVFDENTIRVCCFAGQTDISPLDSPTQQPSAEVRNTPVYVTLANIRRLGRSLWPPSATVIRDLFERGFEDARRFLLDNDMIQCDPCYQKSKHSGEGLKFAHPNPTISPCATPKLSRAQQQVEGEHGNLVQNAGTGNSIISKDPNPLQQILCAKLEQNSPPDIVIADTEPTRKPANRGTHKGNTLAERRRSHGQTAKGLLPTNAEDRFNLAADQLPSCPPSPNLSRSCKECFKLRLAAKNAQVDEEVRQVIERFCSAEPAKRETSWHLSRKLASPLRWTINQLRSGRHSYDLNEESS